ncbi:cache domain-containing protein [Allorhizobium pseudoryzae]|uniref:cache domain-containing protein n=1 Tax=Allorhizobium pseudoryzae TaxID=379684 RepID=UPI003D006695
MKISHQLLVLVCGLILAFAGATYLQLSNSASVIKHERFELLRTQVESGISVLAVFQKKEQAGELTRAEAQAEAYKIVSQIKFEPAGYLFGNDYNVIQRFHPNPVNIGKDTSSWADKAGTRFSVDFVNKGRAGGGITTYFWASPVSQKTRSLKRPPIRKRSNPGRSWFRLASTWMISTSRSRATDGRR